MNAGDIISIIGTTISVVSVVVAIYQARKAKTAAAAAADAVREIRERQSDEVLAVLCGDGAQLRKELAGNPRAYVRIPDFLGHLDENLHHIAERYRSDVNAGLEQVRRLYRTLSEPPTKDELITLNTRFSAVVASIRRGKDRAT